MNIPTAAPANTNAFIDSQGWEEENTPMRTPDEEGVAGKAWLLRPKQPSPQKEATLCTWLVNRPGAHPYWDWWTVSVIHLHDVEGLPSAERVNPEAEYEFQILAIDPDQQPDPDLVDDGYEHLSPPDVIEQFHGLTEADAFTLAKMAIREILDGRLSPDEDFRFEWNKLIRAKVAEFHAGAHRPN